MLHLLLALLWLAPPSRAADTLVLPLTRRDGGTRVRGLLRNATLPLHGAVRDYGYITAPACLLPTCRTQCREIWRAAQACAA